MTILSVVGARPNFMKVAPLHRAFIAQGFRSRIVHTGQHYDRKMSEVFFEQLGLPEPHVYLGVGSGTHAEQTGRIMTAFEKTLDDEQPDLVVVVGDVNSTLACSLVAAKAHVPLAHVEAGLRSGDRRMPEEINRLVTDALADFLFVTEEEAVENLRREGVPEEKIFFVGNVMIDALVHFREAAQGTGIVEKLDLTPGRYVLMTMHRPANVDHAEGCRALVEMVEAVAAHAPLVFPVHPRTQARLEAFGLTAQMEAVPGVQLLGPLGYLEFLRLMEAAAAVVTDSGGIQEETTFLGVPCLTLRDSTERPVTITAGTNKLLPAWTPEAVAEHVRGCLEAGQEEASVPPLWDGRAAERIAACLAEASPLAEL